MPCHSSAVVGKCSLQNLGRVIEHLQNLEPDYYGQIVIRVREGQAVTITNERVIKLAEDHQKQRPSGK